MLRAFSNAMRACCEVSDFNLLLGQVRSGVTCTQLETGSVQLHMCFQAQEAGRGLLEGKGMPRTAGNQGLVSTPGTAWAATG